jgi:hypothetical protein
MERSGFIYIWKDRKGTGRYYIGAHWGTEDDGYICSSRIMREAYRRRPQDFRRRILKKFDTREEMFKEEYRLLNLIKPEELGAKYYNKCVEWKHWAQDETKIQKIREINSNISKALHNDPEYRAKYLKGLKNRVVTKWKDPEARAKAISESKKKAFEEKRAQGRSCFEGQAAENLKKGIEKRRGRKMNLSPERIAQLKEQAKNRKDPLTGRFKNAI